MLVGGNFNQQGGVLSFDACKASRTGGGLRIKGSFTQAKGSKTHFKACEAGRSGGGVDVLHNITLAGSTDFQTCVTEGGQDILHGEWQSSPLESGNKSIFVLV